ncbi:MAG: D-sedoheptulose 7-phosphate isomerase [Acidobacteriota bacterium]|nr:MAG: D-sedoheptulose 7-phosphate isomerase [Acidobacteriota bacterium]
MQLNEFTQIAEEHVFLVKRFMERQADVLVETAHRLIRVLQGGGKILLFGNGGSAADAQHIAAEMVGRFQIERPGVPAISLTADSSTLTSIANDAGFEFVFARQIEALGRKGDAAIAISTSGNSINVIEGLRAARDKQMLTVALLGRDGGRAQDSADMALVVSGQKTSRIQEIHCLIGHMLCEAIEKELFLRRD